jgi:hypothetical protein
MYQFIGILSNVLYPEEGVNISVKGLGEKIILAPQGPSFDLDHKQDDNTLTLTLAPSSGTTEGRIVKVELENGTEETTTNELDWVVKITASSDSDPVKLELLIYDKEQEMEEGEDIPG